MKATSWIFRSLTQNEFKAITNQIQSQGGGSQTYIDLPKGSISDANLNIFFGPGTSTNANDGYKWEVPIHSLSLSTAPQTVVISQRRASSNCIREQNGDKRVNIWKGDYSPFPQTDYDAETNPIIVFILKDENGQFWAGWFYKNEYSHSWLLTRELADVFYKDAGYAKFSNPIAFNKMKYDWPFCFYEIDSAIPMDSSFKENRSYLAAMRTKPFVLLAGISGTGKSRIVKEFAFASCPNPFKGNSEVAPGNYCMIEVKPNWHDSTELLGYVSSIPKPHYVVSPFINFLIKAHYNPDVPFFVCLDEMNLAPVEQYFAEFLSVLESRKNVGDTIVTEPIIKPEIVEKYYDDFFKAYNCIEEKKLHTGYDSDVLDDKADETATYGVQNLEDLKKVGIRLPANLVVIGTVNMDETTYQFSRKVIDRAMTIEMNEVNFEKLFDTEATDTLSYTDQPLGKENFIPQFASAKDALAAMKQADKDYLRTKLPALLQELDKILENTPFRIAYRVENEMIIHYASLRRELTDKTPDELLPIMVDNIMMMKVLPRIGGNEDMLNEPLKALHKLVTDNSYANAQAKIEEMMTRLAANHFTSYWP